MIGIYDSGVGGLAILQRVRELMPTADLVYLADQANVPYGERSLGEVRSLAERAVQILVDLGVTAVVIACNTASSAALGYVRERFDIPIVGMEPAVKPAASATRTGIVGVLATPTTFAASGFDELVGRFAAGVRVIAHPCPGWADAIEVSWPARALEPVRLHLEPLLAQGVDTIVLACTHYTFIAGVIRQVVGEGVEIIDPAEAVARQAARVADGGGTGSTSYLTTGSPHVLRSQIGRLLGLGVEVGFVG
jgi:glutamate racemase